MLCGNIETNIVCVGMVCYIMNDDVLQQISTFKQSLGRDTVDRVVRKHLTFGGSYILSPEQYFNLKAEIADHFLIHPSEVLRARLGTIVYNLAHELPD